MKLYTTLLVFVFCCVVAAELTHYHDHKVIRATLTKEAQLQIIEKFNMDVWSRDGLAVLGENDIMVSREQIKVLEYLRVKYTVIIEDVEKLNQDERDQMSIESPLASFHDSYHTYDQIVAFLQNLTNTHSSLAKYVTSIGLSYEGRNIPAVEITGGKSSNKKSIFISGGQHAREWIAPATVLYITDQLISKYGIDQTTTNIVDNFNIYIVPLVNPDGYTFSQTNTRLWRKNRRRNSNGSFGVDLNRNWDDHWCEYGASTNPSSDTYCGTSPFSESETKATSAYALEHQHAALVDFHSYGQLVLRPYGWTTTPPPTETLLKSVGDGIAATIKSFSGKTYTSEHGADLYPASGAADDWGYSQAKVPIVFTLELRDTGSYGFQLPANQIIPTGQESYAAFEYLTTRL